MNLSNNILVSLLSSHSAGHGSHNPNSTDVKKDHEVVGEDGSKPKDRTKKRRRRLPAW